MSSNLFIHSTYKVYAGQSTFHVAYEAVPVNATLIPASTLDFAQCRVLNVKNEAVGTKTRISVSLLSQVSYTWLTAVIPDNAQMQLEVDWSGAIVEMIECQASIQPSSPILWYAIIAGGALFLVSVGVFMFRDRIRDFFRPKIRRKLKLKSRTTISTNRLL
jgi:hypothetical protein